MAIDYDKLNAAYAMLRTLRQEFLDGRITALELKAQEDKIKLDIRAILGMPLPTP